MRTISDIYPKLKPGSHILVQELTYVEDSNPAKFSIQEPNLFQVVETVRLNDAPTIIVKDPDRKDSEEEYIYEGPGFAWFLLLGHWTGSIAANALDDRKESRLTDSIIDSADLRKLIKKEP